MRKRKEYYEYPRRLCHTMHECAVCGGTIRSGEFYFDGGLDRRCHVGCAPPNKAVKLDRAKRVVSIACDSPDTEDASMGHWIIYRIGEMNELSLLFRTPGYSCQLAKRTQRHWLKVLDRV